MGNLSLDPQQDVGYTSGKTQQQQQQEFRCEAMRSRTDQQSGGDREGFGSTSGRTQQQHQQEISSEAMRSCTGQQLQSGGGRERLPCIQVDDVAADVFEVLLRFIYTDSVGELDAHWAWAGETQRLLDAAERYLMLSMKVGKGCTSKFG